MIERGGLGFAWCALGLGARWEFYGHWALGMDLGGFLDPGLFGELHMMIPLGDLHCGAYFYHGYNEPDVGR
jgi:hypothetical protein